MVEGNKIVITGGGTGGHVFPAIAIAENLKRRGFGITYIGSARGFEAKVVPQKGFEFLSVDSGALKNQGALKKIRSLWHLLKGLLQAIRDLRNLKPVAVVGVGGYVSVPVVLAAFLMRIPIYLQEQNASVGLANRFLGHLARMVFLGFPQAATSFPKGKSILSGNPLRDEFTRPVAAYRTSPKRLLVLGGSQGAKAINQVMVDCLPELKSIFPDLFILHQTGIVDQPEVERMYQEKYGDHFQVVAFVDQVCREYDQASLVVARAGALTVSELIQRQRPALFVPYPRRGQNDQTANAYYLETVGVAQVVEQGDDFKNRFWETLLKCLDPESLNQMASKYSTLQGSQGTDTIGHHIETDLRRFS